MLLEIFVVLLGIWALAVRWEGRRFRKLADQLKNPLRALPYIGHSYLLVGNEEERMKGLQIMGKAAIESGGTTSIWHASKLYIMTADPEVADVVLKNCLDKDDLMKFFHMVSGDGSVFTSVPIWRPRRKFLAPTFNMKNLNRFVEVFSAQSCIMVDKLKQVADTGPSSMWKVISSYTMDAVCGTTLGVQVKAQENPDQPFLIALDELFQIAATRICKPWLHFDFVFKNMSLYQTVMKHKDFVYKFIDEIIRDKRKLSEKNNHPSQVGAGLAGSKQPSQSRLRHKAALDHVYGSMFHLFLTHLRMLQINTHKITIGLHLEKQQGLKPFIELLLESAEDENDVVVREECLVIMGAGIDTSAVGMGYIMLMLARHPEVQEKVYTELKEVLGDSHRPIVAEDLHCFKYLEAVIKETLRLYPPAPIIARKIEKEIELPSGVVLIPGCGAFINIWAVHHNPAYWGEDADQFRPERFLDSSPKHPAAFMPFSYGPRNCLGYQYALMSMKTVLVTLLRRYRLVPAVDEPKHEPLRVKYDIMMRHVGDYTVSIETRK